MSSFLPPGADMKQAEALWKMLDDMAESSPEQYKEFVQKNIKEGIQQVSQEHKDKQEASKVKVEAGLLITCRLKAQLREKPVSGLEQKLLVNKEEKKEVVPPQPQAKLNINVVHSPKVLSVLDHGGNEIRELRVEGLAMWKTIPMSFSEFGQRQNDSGQTVYYSIVAVNSDLYRFVGKDQRRLQMLKDVVRDYVGKRLETDHNPCQGDWAYSIQRMTFEINRKKNFKFLKQKTPPTVLIEQGVDREVRERRMKARAKQEIVTPKDVAPQPVLKASTPGPAKPQGKSFVQQVKEQKTAYIEELPERYFTQQLQTLEDRFELVFNFSQPFQLKQLDLDVAEQAVRLTVKGLKTQIELARKVKVESTQAKKKGKVLRLVLPFQ